jgi:hypothetical protein
MISHLFTTDLLHAPSNISPDLLDSIVSWVDSQNMTDVAADGSRATIKGQQYEPKGWPWQIMPMWNEIHTSLGPTVNTWATNLDISTYKVKITGYWFVWYDEGGYQEPHLHPGNQSGFTLILGLKGSGDVLLHDPRGAAVKAGFKSIHKITVNQGDVVIMPSWLIHSSAPSDNQRRIMVIDGTVE